MRLKYAWMIMLLCCSFAVKAQTDQPALLRKACLKFDSALVAKDTVALKALLKNGFRITHTNGMQETKAQLLEHVAGGYVTYDEIKQTGEANIGVSAVGATQVTRTLQVSGSLDGQHYSVKLIADETWLWNNKEQSWKLWSRESKKTN